jgi:hypothetical protein
VEEQQAFLMAQSKESKNNWPDYKKGVTDLVAFCGLSVDVKNLNEMVHQPTTLGQAVEDEELGHRELRDMCVADDRRFIFRHDLKTILSLPVKRNLSVVIDE